MSAIKFASPCENIHILHIGFQPPKQGVQICQVTYANVKRKSSRPRVCYGYGPNTYQAVADALANLEMETSPSRRDDSSTHDEPVDLDFDLPAGDDAFLIPAHDQAPANTGA
jgi:hypothetical protein